MLARLYFATLTLWNYLFSRQKNNQPSTTTINIVLNTEPSENEPCMVEYDYNKY